MTRFVLVAGAGRSGTSTVAGALKLLGLHVPQPEVEADETNPRGFFESRWVVDYHHELLNRSPVVRTLDSRPEAAALGDARADGPRNNQRLSEFVAGLAEHDQVVVKDPRTIWFHRLWRQAVATNGGQLAFVTMLRHPVEVSSSRDTWYTPDRGDDFRRHRATANVAGWVNINLATERATRGDVRRFVPYVDLLADWRAAMAPVVETLGLTVAPPLETRPHPVDDFVEPTLRRADPDWDGLDLPDALREVAEAAWTHLQQLAGDPHDDAASAALDELSATYARLHDQAVAMALDHTSARETHVRRRSKANTAAEYEERIHELEQQLDEAHDTGSWERRRD